MNLVDAFRLLDLIRESGVTNMFGAASFLEAKGMPKAEARRVHAAWMKTFDETSTVEERAARAVQS